MRGSYRLGLMLVALYFVAGTVGDLAVLVGIGTPALHARLAWAGHLASFVLLAAALAAFTVGWHREAREEAEGRDRGRERADSEATSAVRQGGPMTGPPGRPGEFL